MHYNTNQPGICNENTQMPGCVIQKRLADLPADVNVQRTGGRAVVVDLAVLA